MHVTYTPTLAERLATESDLCRHDGASDIAALLDEAVIAVAALAELVEARRLWLLAGTELGAVTASGKRMDSAWQRATAIAAE
jgi:hypothetical protein